MVKEVLIEDLKNRYGYNDVIFCQPRILKKHLRKTIIKYTIQFDKFHKGYIGIHRQSDDRRFGHVFRVLDFLRSHGFNETSELRVPRPVIFIPSLYFMIMDEAEGNLLSTAIMEQRENAESFIERSAKWLAKLHNTPDSFSCSEGRKITKANSNSLAGIYNNHGVDEEKQDILTSIKYSKSLMIIFPKLVGRIEGISKELIAMQRKHCSQSNITPNGVGKLSLIHGDYHSKNIYVSDNCITVIDLEESRVGDPAFDLGYFIAQLKMSFGFSTTVIRWGDLFIRKYLEESRFLMQNPRSDDEATLARRMKIYEAQTYFQRSYHTYYLLGLTPDTELVSRWLEESRLVLEVAKEVHN